VIIMETDWSHGGDKIILKNTLEAAQLKDKVIGIYLMQGSLLHFLGKYLDHAGLMLSDIKLIETDTEILSENFIQGVFSAIISFDPDALRAQKDGQGKVVATSADFEGIIPEGLMMLKNTFEDTPQEDLRKLIAGWIDALAWMNAPESQAELLTLANQYLFRHSGNVSAVELEEMMAGVRFHTRTDLLARNRDGGTLAYFAELSDFFQRNDLLESSFDPALIFDARAINAALAQ
jgi:NitT/TauT family transport system substrate-binding protein